jgi:energy-coupling factor transporter ATP-binding protein EcfA2
MEKAVKIKDIIKVFSPMPLKTKEELDEFRIETIKFRMGSEKKSPIDNLFKICTSVQNSCILMGHRGCGKSTELNNLSKKLEDNEFTTLSIDTATECDLLNIDYFDVMLLITEGLLKIAEQKNIALNNDLIKSILNFFKETVSETTTEENEEETSGVGIGINIPILSVLGIFAGFKDQYKYNTGKRETIKDVVNRKSSLWLKDITEISDKIINNLNLKKPILILEGLDKLEHEERAFNIFTNATLSKLDFPIIYTFPISLRYSSKFQDVVNIFGANIFTLPMVKITNKDNTPYEEGRNTLKEIIKKRADESLFEEGALDLLISKTGGSIRDIFNCIVSAAYCAENAPPPIYQTTILKEDVELALIDLKTQLRLVLETKDYAKLWEIHRRKRNIENRELMLYYLRGRVVLEYNGDAWCDLHPLILDFIEERFVENPKLKPDE